VVLNAVLLAQAEEVVRETRTMPG